MTIDLLSSEAKIDSTSAIHSLNTLVPMIVFGAKHPKIQGADKKKMLYWFYASSICGRYSESADTRLNADISQLVNKGSMARLIKKAKVDRLPRLANALAGESQNSPFYTVAYSLFRIKNAKDWHTQQPISNSMDTGLTLQHIFPRAELRKTRDANLMDELANLAFISKSTNSSINDDLPEKYLPAIASRNEQLLSSQCVPVDEKLWKLENYKRFLGQRKKLIAKEINQLLSQ